jgi:AcrR family transcriptional regulator
VQDITEAAGVPKGSFYNHFESKEDLGAEVVLRYLESSNKTQPVLRDPKLSPYARLRKYFEGLVQVAEKKEFCGGCQLLAYILKSFRLSQLVQVEIWLVWSGIASEEINIWCSGATAIGNSAQHAERRQHDSPFHVDISTHTSLKF